MDKIKELFSYCVSMPGAKKRQRPSTGTAEERSSPSKRNKANGNSSKVTPVKATNNNAVQEEAQVLLSQNSASVISAQSPPIAQSQEIAPTLRDETRSPSKPRRSKGRASTRVENTEESRASIGEQQQTTKEETGKCNAAITPLQVSDAQNETNEMEEETHNNNNTSAVVAQHNEKDTAAAQPESGGVHALEHIVLRSKVVAPDVSGIRCIAVNASESELVVARENGSLVLYRIEFFQNVPHFTLLRHTGGVTQRTITRLLYLTAPAYTNSNNSSMNISSTGAQREWLVASYLSGQIVLYDTVTLFPCSVVQRAGGAVWDMCRVGPSALYAAMANNTWHQLELTNTSTAAKEQVNAFAHVELVLRRIIPGVTGADRALTVACSLSMQIAVGGDDAGNVHAWLPSTYINIEEGTGGENIKGRGMDNKKSITVEESRRGGLGEHTTLWTTRLPAGMALALLCVPHSVSPVIVAGTSIGDVVLLDPQHGQQLHRFSQHKGPVTALVSDGVAFYASGWHESLRAYRCTTTTTTDSTQATEYAGATTLGWYPAEVKRRTHYHEATQLLLCAKHELLLSCARDGTILYSPLSQLFRSPAMYLTVTTQQFAFAQSRNILLQSRVDRVEGFGMSTAQRHWLPLFAHRLQGGHHLSGLWCDAALNYFVAATDERVVVCHVMWRKAKKEGTTMPVRALHEVLELPARRGVLDACFVAPSSTHQRNTDEEKKRKKKSSARASWLYLLTDDGVAFASLSADASPIVVHTAFDLGNGAVNTSLAHTLLRPLRVLYDTASDELRVFGLYGMWQCRVLHDGTPDASTQQLRRDRAYSLVHAVPKLHTITTSDEKDEHSAKEDDERQEGEECTWIGLALSTQHNNNNANNLSAASSPSATDTRYMTHIQRELPQQQLARTLPHDTQFVAELATSLRFAPPREESPFYARRGKARLSSSSSPSPTNEGRAALVEKYNTTTNNGEATNKNERDRAYVGYFSKGLLVSNGAAWRMAQRMSVEAAFVMQDNIHVLVLERNLEKTLESLPLCWKVRRFGN